MQNKRTFYRLDITQWNVERFIFLIAGLFVVTFSILGAIVHPNFHYASLFVGGMLVFFALTGYCPMAIFVSAFLNRHRPDKTKSKLN